MVPMDLKSYYLDTSALVKRYVTEPGSETVDKVFNEAYSSIAILNTSYWNIGEAAGVFDKYGMRLGLDSRKVFLTLLRELKLLSRENKLTIINVSPKILRESIKLVFKHHIYLADALQIESARSVDAEIILTGDKRLSEIAKEEGFKVVFLKEDS